MFIPSLLTLLACKPKAATPHTGTAETPATVADAAPQGQKAPAKAAAKGRAAAADLPKPDSGLAASAPTPVAMLDLEEARLGVAVPNAIKGMAVAWDPQRSELWHAGIFSSWLIAHDPDNGNPLRAIDIGVDGFNPARMHIDAERRRLVWVSARKEQVRIVDLDNGTLVHKIDVEGRGQSSYPTSANDLDIATGRIWVWNANNSTLNGYDLAGGETRPITGVTRVFDLSAAPSGGKLAVLDATSREAARVLVVDTVAGSAVEVCTFTGRPPNQVVMLDDGGMVLGGPKTRRVDADCNELWTVDLVEAPDDLYVAGDTVVGPMATAGMVSGGIGSKVALIDLATGTLRAQVDSRWEARHMAYDPAGARVFVGNGGDGSATSISLPDGKAASVLSLASSADDVVVDPTTGDRYVLSRLGGSRIWRWKKDGTVELFTDQAAWPFALELDAERRLLIAPSYFEAKLYAWPLDGGEPTIIDMGIPGSTGDALGELGYDPATGVAAVIMPMHGWLSVIDIAAGSVRYTRQFEDLAYGAKSGPGKTSVAVAGDSIFVAAPVESRIWRLDAKTDRVMAEGTLPAASSGDGGSQDQAGAGPRGGRRGGGPPEGASRGGRGDGPPGNRGARGGGGREGAGEKGEKAGKAGRAGKGGKEKLDRGNLYAFGLLHHDAAGNRLFYGNHVMDPDTLTVQRSLNPKDMKVIYSDAEVVIALAVTASGREDSIVELDPDTLATRQVTAALSSPTAHAEGTYDPTTGTVWLADLPRARVTGFKVR